MGSQAIYNACRGVIYFINDPASDDVDDGYRIAYQRKENYARLGHPERWQIEEATVGTDPETGEPMEVPKATFVEEAWEYDREDLLSPPKRRPGRLEEAKEFLRTRLAGGPMLSAQLRDLAEQGGISKNTLYRAAEEIDVVRTQGKGSTWRLP
jgi:hypothetical protein